MNETEWFEGRSTDEHQRAYRWRVYGFAVVLGVVLAVFMAPLQAEPMAVADRNGIKITLDTDKCALPEVTNLPLKATWEEKGKVYQGCWGPNPDVGVVVAYFDDKTVALIPMQYFEKIRNT